MNSHFKLVSLLTRSLWAIDKEYAVNRLPFISAILDGKMANVKFSKQDLKPISAAVSARYGSSVNQTATKIGVVSIKGELLKDGDWCVYGMKDYIEEIKFFDADPDVCGIILNIDSPGGTVDGTYAFGEVIKNTKKPIVAYSDGLIASAAYWISAASDYIICDNKTCQVGSIGVMTSFADFQPYYEKAGVKFHTILADRSKDKNRVFEDICQDKYEEYRDTVLNPLADEFISKVNTFRSGVDSSALTGTVYFADKAVEMGLIDEIGTFDRAVEKVLELAEKAEPNSQTNTSTNMGKKTYSKLSAILGADHVFGKDGSHLSPDQLEAVEKAISSGANPNSELENLRKNKIQLVSEIKKLEAAIINRNQQIENLKNGKGTSSATDNSDVEAGASEETLVQFAEKNAGNTSAILSKWKESKGLQ